MANLYTLVILQVGKLIKHITLFCKKFTRLKGGKAASK